MSTDIKPPPHTHRFPRLSTTRLICHWGVSEIWTCNDCMAIKVVFSVDAIDSTHRTEEYVVEPRYSDDIQP